MRFLGLQPYSDHHVCQFKIDIQGRMLPYHRGSLSADHFQACCSFVLFVVSFVTLVSQQKPWEPFGDLREGMLFGGEATRERMPKLVLTNIDVKTGREEGGMVRALAGKRQENNICRGTFSLVFHIAKSIYLKLKNNKPILSPLAFLFKSSSWLIILSNRTITNLSAFPFYGTPPRRPQPGFDNRRSNQCS